MNTELKDLYLNINKLKILSYSIKESVFTVERSNEFISQSNQTTKKGFYKATNERVSINDHNTTYILADALIESHRRRDSIDFILDTQNDQSFAKNIINEEEYLKKQVIEGNNLKFGESVCNFLPSYAKSKKESDNISDQLEIEIFKTRIKDLQEDNEISNQDLKDSITLNKLLVEKIKKMDKDYLEQDQKIKRLIEENFGLKESLKFCNIAKEELEKKLKSIAQIASLSLNEYEVEVQEYIAEINRLSLENTNLREILKLNNFKEEDYNMMMEDINKIQISLQKTSEESLSATTLLEKKKIINDEEISKSNNQSESATKLLLENYEKNSSFMDLKPSTVLVSREKGDIKFARNSFFKKKFEAQSNSNLDIEEINKMISLSKKSPNLLKDKKDYNDGQDLVVDFVDSDEDDYDYDSDEDDLGNINFTRIKNQNLKLTMDEIDDFEEDIDD